MVNCSLRSVPLSIAKEKLKKAGIPPDFEVRGELLMEDGKPISSEQYRAYLRTVLSPSYLENGEFQKYEQALLGREAPQPGRSYGW